MTTYPGAIDELKRAENIPGIQYNAEDKKTVYAEDTNDRIDAIIAVQTTLGVEPAGAFETVVDRLNASDAALGTKEDSIGYTPENAANKSTATSLGASDTLYPTQKAVKTYIDAAIVAAFAARYPVGTTYTNTNDPTNPAVFMGFGTWVLSSKGRMHIGKADSGTFQNAGSTGGAETVTLTSTEMPSHNHTGNTDWVGDHQHGMYNTYNNGAGNNRSNLANGSSVSWSAPATGWAGSHYHTFTTASTGGGAAHENMPPYIVVYVWERTA